MTKKMITMSYQALDRIELIQAAVSGELKQAQVVERLQLSTRQVKRPVKELRLRAINTIEEANAFLPAFMADYNRRFGEKVY